MGALCLQRTDFSKAIGHEGNIRNSKKDRLGTSFRDGPFCLKRVGRLRRDRALHAIWDTATNTLEISYQTAKSTLPVWGRWKIFWNSVTAAWVAGP